MEHTSWVLIPALPISWMDMENTVKSFILKTAQGLTGLMKTAR